LRTALDDPITAAGYPAFIDELKTSGFVEGKKLAIATVRIDQDAAQLFAQTAALARSNVQLLVTEGTEAALQAAEAASQSTPIVMWQ